MLQVFDRFSLKKDPLILCILLVVVRGSQGLRLKTLFGHIIEETKGISYQPRIWASLSYLKFHSEEEEIIVVDVIHIQVFFFMYFGFL